MKNLIFIADHHTTDGCIQTIINKIHPMMFENIVLLLEVSYSKGFNEMNENPEITYENIDFITSGKKSNLDKKSLRQLYDISKGHTYGFDTDAEKYKDERNPERHKKMIKEINEYINTNEATKSAQTYIVFVGWGHLNPLDFKNPLHKHHYGDDVNITMHKSANIPAE